MRSISDVSSSKILFYYIFVTIFFIHSLYKFRKDPLFVLIIFIFFIGLFAYAGKSIQNIYRILTVLYALYLMQRTVKMKIISKNKLIVLSFIFFSLTFLLSLELSKSNIALTSSFEKKSIVIFPPFSPFSM